MDQANISIGSVRALENDNRIAKLIVEAEELQLKVKDDFKLDKITRSAFLRRISLVHYDLRDKRARAHKILKETGKDAHELISRVVRPLCLSLCSAKSGTGRSSSGSLRDLIQSRDRYHMWRQVLWKPGRGYLGNEENA